MTKRLRHQVTCRCSAYKFPHRFLSGKCDGIHVCAENVGGTLCKSCNLMNNGCEVLKGQESPLECAYVQDFIQYYEIKI